MSLMACTIQTTCISFRVVQTTKGELRKLKFKTCRPLTLYSRIIVRCNSFSLESGLHFPIVWGDNKAKVSNRCYRKAQIMWEKDKERAAGCKGQCESLSIQRCYSLAIALLMALSISL